MGNVASNGKCVFQSNKQRNCIPSGDFATTFYDYKADEAVNYGGIGAVIGHEISHGFDDSGSRYNADGNLVNWWSDEDLKQFTTLGKCFSRSIFSFRTITRNFVDGKFTLGENRRFRRS